jgi:prepilin-type N-terminal cleavage/methylation domain-containing protein
MKVSITRSGLSLIEMILAMAIIGIAVGLILPAIAKVRESASRASSMNKLKQIAVALQNISARENGNLPGVQNATRFKLSSDPEALRDRSPLLALLPYLESPIVYMKMAWLDDREKPRNWQWLSIFMSNSDPTLRWLDPETDIHGPSSYSANMMAFDRLPNIHTSFPDGTSTTIAFCDRNSMSNLTSAKTINLANNEVMNNVFFYDTFSASFLGIPGGSRRSTFADPGWGDVLPVTTGTPAVSRASVIGLTFAVKPPLTIIPYHVPASPHHGLLVAMFDGSVRLLSPSISETSYWALVIRDRGDVASVDE